MSAVVLEGRLSPRSILLRIADQAFQIGLLAFFVYTRGSYEAGIYLLLAGAAVGISVVEYFRFRYRLTEDALEVRSGVFVVRHRRIALDRIHDLAHARTPLRRMLGVVTVSVETASSAGAEAKLDALLPEQAEALRAAIERITGGMKKRPHADVQRDDVPLHRSRPRDLLLLGATDNRAGLLLVGLLVGFEFLTQFSADDRAAHATTLLVQYLEQEGARVGWLTAIGIVSAVFVVVGWLLSAVMTHIKFAGFTLTERDGVFRRRYGLLTTIEQAVPRRYIQILRLERSPLRRLVGLCVVRADNAGASLDPKAKQRGVDVFLPATSPMAAEALVPRVLEQTPDDGALTRVSGTLWRRWTFRAALVGGGFGALLLLRLPAPLAVGLAVAPPLVALVAGLLAWRKHRYHFDGRLLQVRWGILGRYRAYVPADRIQCVRLYATPFDRLAGVVHARVIVTGGTGVRVAYLPRAEAEALRDALVPAPVSVRAAAAPA